MGNVETKTVNISAGPMRPGGSAQPADGPGMAAVLCDRCYRPAHYSYSFISGRAAVPHQVIVCPVCDLTAA